MDKVSDHDAYGHTPLTTFVKTDTNTFQEIVQRLTGPSGNDASQVVPNVAGRAKRPTYALYERRDYMKKKLAIDKPSSHFILNSSTDFQSFAPSNLSNSSSFSTSKETPMSSFSKQSILHEKNSDQDFQELNTQEEEKAIRERRFYLHPSPRHKSGFTEPELLTLFPLTSPQTTDNDSFK